MFLEVQYYPISKSFNYFTIRKLIFIALNAKSATFRKVVSSSCYNYKHFSVFDYRLLTVTKFIGLKIQISRCKWSKSVIMSKIIKVHQSFDNNFDIQHLRLISMSAI